ncbi:small ribosomal subunit Rsm22 family protein [Mesorhizobium sp. BAC0120]|uniref:small ribosomal subunit Rsm22 family protein n=1 Tax=Mesorhizobium sp. BAC0120 TaxID=3090670 RepID=UPI00298C1674|nr:small ribosomal subunit Rsm22 family protein [Mesorhizobium sp. BAC0120]MDW6021255.1 small ribosomal subunit Rsm22 family protein [Mesorhizobium sp. BAC0120]
MELPSFLRQGIDRMLEGVPIAELRHSAELLSRRYRAEMRDGKLHLADEFAVKAYLATRLPATYAAIRAAMGGLSEALPEFGPKSLLDIGAGPGSALWAAANCWPGLEQAALVEASTAVRKAGEELMSDAPLPHAQWITADLAGAFPTLSAADLVTIAYVLDELPPAAIGPLVERLWELTAGVLLIVEPGTPAGWGRILEARRQLVELGARLVAPCPHEAPCPLKAPDWCHFARRVARSRLHRLAKLGDVPWEDEKFIYLTASRMPAAPPGARVLAPPRSATGRVTLKLCHSDGTASELAMSKREGAVYKQARRLDWGDIFLPGR